MRCPKCGTEMQTARTLDRSALTVRMRHCPNGECRTTFVTEEVPGDPRLYHRLRAEDAACQRRPARRRGKRARRLRRAA
jgi:hypothetical protein